MYGIFTYMWVIFGKYSIHGASGISIIISDATPMGNHPPAPIFRSTRTLEA
jgi:hypothetical protein